MKRFPSKGRCTPRRPLRTPTSPAHLCRPAGQLAEEDSKNRELMARQENGLQQLVRGEWGMGLVQR